jgi:hypothetical protein
MKNSLIRLAVGVAMLSAPALMAEEASVLAPASEIAATAAEFAAKLPPKVFVYISHQSEHAATGRGIESLGATPNTEFFNLPLEASAPSGVRRNPPVFPRELASGSARIMALIAPSGAVTAVYCLETTHPEIGSHAARAVAKWRFRPAKLAKEAVPVVFTQLIEFKSEKP